jgi:Fe-S cluster biogenesis protein NfuA
MMAPLLAGKQPEITEEPQGATEEERMAYLIESISAYVEHYHNGSVRMVGRDGDKIQVEMGGACVGCPLTTETLSGWVLGTVKQFFPEIQHIEAVESKEGEV